MLKKILKGLLAITAVVLAVVVWQFLFPAPSVLVEGDDYGPTPKLVAPQSSLVPAVRPAKAAGWPDGEMPSPANGLAINAFVSGLDHPRWLHVLPNGDVLVAESNAPAGSGLCSELKKLAANVVMKYAGSRTESADRISLHRDTNGDGVADESHVFADGLHSPFGMALIGNDLYVANADAVVRFTYTPGMTTSTTDPEVIAQLPAGTVENLLKPENKDKLIAILTYHVVPGKVMSSDLLTTASAKTVNGESASFGLRVGDANVVKADIEASNGVIHVIDRVLIP